MADSINNLYMKYCNRVERYLENDAYYQYLIELIASGKTTITQQNRVMDKRVDEKWLTAIEDALPSIHTLIANPRKFIKTIETLSPVELVKKVGSDTVRHLAAHTQYISGMRGGEIFPGKLLTSENAESIDLYENRFVNTLITRLSDFIEKRTGAIFWDTGNEEASVLRMESTVEDDYESIEYKLDITVRSKQTYLENDLSKIDIFKRIDRIRRVVADFRKSTFVQILSQAPAVRPPIQRTNQIVKNPDYHKCYVLWQFLERYDEVGYDIDIRDTALEFDENYLFQMYGNLAMNYTVFKSLLEGDSRRLTEAPKRRKVVKPKFVKQIVEEFVDDYDLPDVVIRQVIVEEITRAQVEIQRRTALREKEKERLAAAKEKEREKAAALKAKEKEKADAIKAKEREKERAAAALEREKEKAKLAALKAKEKAKADAAKAKEKEKADALKAKEKEKADAAKAKEKEKADALKAKEKAAAAKEKEKEKADALKAKELEKQTADTAKATQAKKTTPKPKPPAAKKPTVKTTPKTTPKTAVTVTPQVVATPEPQAVAAPEPQVIVVPEPQAVATPEPQVVAAPEPQVVATPAPQVIAAPAPQAVATPEPQTVDGTTEPTESNPLLGWIARRKANSQRKKKQ